MSEALPPDTAKFQFILLAVVRGHFVGDIYSENLSRPLSGHQQASSAPIRIQLLPTEVGRPVIRTDLVSKKHHLEWSDCLTLLTIFECLFPVKRQNIIGPWASKP